MGVLDLAVARSRLGVSRSRSAARKGRIGARPRRCWAADQRRTLDRNAQRRDRCDERGVCSFECSRGRVSSPGCFGASAAVVQGPSAWAALRRCETRNRDARPVSGLRDARELPSAPERRRVGRAEQRPEDLNRGHRWPRARRSADYAVSHSGVELTSAAQPGIAVADHPSSLCSSGCSPLNSCIVWRTCAY